MVDPKSLLQVVEVGEKAGYALVSTADGNGWPHLAAAARIALDAANHLVLEEWFCPRTLSNLRVNPKLSVVVWDAASDAGYQVLGELEEEIKEIGMLGCETGKAGVPQEEMRLVVHADRITEFRRAPHSDTEV